MSLQDIPIKNSSSKARVMFDNGSEITLVSSFFTKKNNLPFEEATYTLAGVGSKAITYNSGENGRIYTVPLMDSNGEIVSVKAFSLIKLGGKKLSLILDISLTSPKKLFRKLANPFLGNI